VVEPRYRTFGAAGMPHRPIVQDFFETRLEFQDFLDTV
jgi:hypothetical protein